VVPTSIPQTVVPRRIVNGAKGVRSKTERYRQKNNMGRRKNIKEGAGGRSRSGGKRRKKAKKKILSGRLGGAPIEPRRKNYEYPLSQELKKETDFPKPSTSIAQRSGGRQTKRNPGVGKSEDKLCSRLCTSRNN